MINIELIKILLLAIIEKDGYLIIVFKIINELLVNELLNNYIFSITEKTSTPALTFNNEEYSNSESKNVKFLISISN